jgi:tetratricopeptide (TPR) repeat protein
MTINNEYKHFCILITSCSFLLVVFVAFSIKTGWASPPPSPKTLTSKTKKTNEISPVKSRNKPAHNKDLRKQREEMRNARHMASVFKKVGKFQKAAQIYHQRAEKMDWLDGKAQYLYLEAQTAWAAGNYNKAKEIFDKISNKGAEILKAHLSQASTEDEKKKRSKTLLRFWIDIDHASFALANIEQISGNISRVLAIYQSIEKDSPHVENQKRAVYAMAQIEKRQGNFDNSIQLLEKLLTYEDNKKDKEKTDYANVDLYSSPTEIMGSDSGISPPEESFLVDRNRILLALTDIYEEKKDQKKTIEIYETLAKSSKSETKKQTYLLLLARAYIGAGTLGKAKKTYAEIIAAEKKTLEKRKKFFKNSRVPLKLGLMGQIAEKEMNLLQNKK